MQIRRHMSWEDTGIKYYKCPCSQGTYSIVSSSDDWNRYDERWVMDCVICRDEYRCFSFWENDSGLEVEVKYWIRKETFDLMKDREDRLKVILVHSTISNPKNKFGRSRLLFNERV